MLKVLFCTNSFEHITNGPAKFANLLLNINVLDPGIEVRILTEDISTPVDKVYRMEVRYHKAFRYLGQLIRIFLYNKNIKKIRNEFDYDILMFNHAFHGLLVSYNEKKPIIGMINDDNACSRNFGNFKLNKDWLSYYVYGRLEKFSIKRYRRILVNSKFLRQRIISDYSLPEQLQEKLTVFYKALDTQEQPGPMKTITSPVKVLFVKADFQRGGLFTLAKALALLPDFTFELSVIGPAESYREGILASIGKIPNVVIHFLGYRNADFVKKAMLEQDIFCVPSFQEALGVANLEAQLRGISVISTWAGGIPEVMDNGNNGWLVKAGDARELAQAIQACISNPELRQQKRAAGLQYVQQFDVTIMYQKLKSVFNGIAGK
jgi:glycosyltransferase involved in cell wall biosynthesis